MELLKKLSESPGIPGYEEDIRRIIGDQLKGYVDEISIDSMGNIVCHSQGSTQHPRILIAAHMDEIGFVVKHITNEGFLRVEPVGGFDPRLLLTQSVQIYGDNDSYPGVFGPAKPLHVMTEEQRKELPQIKDLFVDVGMTRSEVTKNISVGNIVIPSQKFRQIGDMVTGKALDDRIGVYVGLVAIKRLMERIQNHPGQLYFVGTTQEEVGIRGAKVAAYELEPDIGIALDVSVACDVPGVTREEAITSLRNGPAIKIKDSLTIPDSNLAKFLNELSDELGVDCQKEIVSGLGTDAQGLQLTREGSLTAAISIPTRYVHSVVESAAKQDIESTINLLVNFLEQAPRKYS